MGGVALTVRGVMDRAVTAAVGDGDLNRLLSPSDWGGALTHSSRAGSGGGALSNNITLEPPGLAASLPRCLFGPGGVIISNSNHFQ